jgi:hypothetical protein
MGNPFPAGRKVVEPKIFARLTISGDDFGHFASTEKLPQGERRTRGVGGEQRKSGRQLLTGGFGTLRIAVLF